MSVKFHSVSVFFSSVFFCAVFIFQASSLNVVVKMASEIPCITWFLATTHSNEKQAFVQKKKKGGGDFPDGQVVETPLQRMWVQSLFSELGFCIPCKKKKSKHLFPNHFSTSAKDGSHKDSWGHMPISQLVTVSQTFPDHVD